MSFAFTGRGKKTANRPRSVAVGSRQGRAGRPVGLPIFSALWADCDEIIHATDPGCEPSNSLSLFDLRPGAPGVIFASLTPLLAPFKGGWLIPAPDLALAITANANGKAFLPFNMPAMSILPGTVIQLQAWFVDGGAINGLSATNGLRARIP